MFDAEHLFLGRQPIVDRFLNTYGYELLFRSTGRNSAYVTDELQACIHVLVDTFSQFGVREVLGPHKGFVNLSRGMLMSESLGLLSTDQIVLELLETVEVTEEVVARCRELKARGFIIALDDNIYDEKYHPLYEIVDIVKVDLQAIKEEDLSAHVAQLQRWPFLLLAEKVETAEMFERCLSLGFTLFQGYYFAKPSMLQQRRITLGSQTVIKLLNVLLRNGDVAAVEQVARANPKLVYHLLKLANSVDTAPRQKIRSIRQALNTVDLERLRKWAYMNLYISKDTAVEVDFGNSFEESSLFRARFMETLADHCAAMGVAGNLRDAAFLTGMLSGIARMAGVPVVEMARNAGVDDEVAKALQGEGPLGSLLLLAEAVESADISQISKLAYAYNLGIDDVSRLQLEVLRWVNEAP